MKIGGIGVGIWCGDKCILVAGVNGEILGLHAIHGSFDEIIIVEVSIDLSIGSRQKHGDVADLVLDVGKSSPVQFIAI